MWFNNSKSYRVFGGAQAPASTDHCLVVAKIAFTMPYATSQKKPTGRVDTSRLTTDRGLAIDYAIAVQERLDMLGEKKEDDVKTMWRKLSGAITRATLDTVGPRRHIKQPWISENTFGVLQLESAARTQGHRV